LEPSCMLHPNIIGAYEKNKVHATSQPGLEVVVDYQSDVQTNYARQSITTVEGETFLKNSTLHQEVFGPFSMVVQCEDASQLETIISQLEGQLTGTIISDGEETSDYSGVIEALKNRVGRMVYNGVPTGVEVCPSMQHGGPYPASTDSRFTAVGIHSIKRWVRPFSYQDWPNELLPDELKNENPLGILRLINGEQTNSKI
ncbi:MAG: aldehyde dehydrogenase (NADP(+)), partial [Flavobacteriaceae bacterium]|nr:aldehyde dehydrogenase (NADP(+)) [Flavobacteriaceae bacterium]